MIESNIKINSNWSDFEKLLEKLNRVKAVRDAHLLIANEVSRKKGDPDKAIIGRSIVYETELGNFDPEYTRDVNRMIVDYVTRDYIRNNNTDDDEDTF